MSNAKAWVFRVLILACIGLLLYTWFQPWWQAYIVALDEPAVQVYPWALDILIPPDYAYLIAGAEDALPQWFYTFMWVYLGALIAALLFSLFASSAKGISIGKSRISLPTALVSVGGLSYIVVVIAAVTVISMNAGNFYGASLQGTVFVEIGLHEMSDVDTSLQTGYWLACAVGPLLVILGLLRNKIIGKIK